MPLIKPHLAVSGGQPADERNRIHSATHSPTFAHLAAGSLANGISFLTANDILYESSPDDKASAGRITGGKSYGRIIQGVEYFHCGGRDLKNLFHLIIITNAGGAENNPIPGLEVF